MSNRKFVKVEQAGKCPTEWLIDLGTVKCGWEVPAGTNPNTVRECGGCERVVVYGDIPRLYLIGPVTGKPNDNRETFRAVRAILRKDGYECDCPHHYIEQGTEWGKAMRTSIRQMLANDGQSTSPLYDGIAMLDGWERSRGAKIEHDIAEALGMPCRPWREWLSPAAPAATMANAPAPQPLLEPCC